jgi:hypothetical protein
LCASGIASRGGFGDEAGKMSAPTRRPDTPGPKLSVVTGTVSTMTTHIDCDTCVVRGLACHDCVVTVLLGPPPELTFDDEERRALDVLAAGGLVPPLRLVEPMDGPSVESA